MSKIEEITYMGVTYEAHELDEHDNSKGDYCKGCCFKARSFDECVAPKYYKFECCSHFRQDHKSIIFKRKKT